MKRFCFFCALLAAFLLLGACQPHSEPPIENTPPKTDKDNTHSAPVNDWTWELGHPFSVEDFSSFTIPLEECKGDSPAIIAFWKDYLLIETQEGQQLHYTRYSLSKGEFTHIGTTAIYSFGTGNAIITEDGCRYFAYIPVDDRENLSFFRINIAEAKLEVLNKIKLWPGAQYYLHNKDSQIWCFWPEAIDPVDDSSSEAVFAYHIDCYDTKTNTSRPIVYKPDSRKEGISCAYATNDTLFAYVYEASGEELHCFIEAYTLSGELLERVSVDSVQGSFSDSREVVWEMSVCDNFYFFWTSFANKFIVLERVGDSFVEVKFPLEKALAAYVPPPDNIDNSRGYLFVDRTLVRYNKESRTFTQHALPEHSKRWINEKGHLLIRSSEDNSQYFLLTDTTW